MLRPMRLLLLTALTMVAFAANSVLTRLALAEHAIAPGAFMGLRLAAGAATLAWLVALRQGGFRMLGQAGGLRPALALLVYMAGFSYAYLSLPTGTGALILFGGVQLTMFGAALIGGERPPIRRWIGMALGLAGLGVLLGPGATAPPAIAAALMVAAAIGWGIYSLYGRRVADPLAATAANFLVAAPAGVALGLFLPGAVIPTSHAGMALAIVSGAVASGLGYALWYSVLPGLGATRAAVAQLSVPVIAAVGGALVVAEPLTLRLAIAATLVLGGLFLAMSGGPAPPAKA